MTVHEKARRTGFADVTRRVSVAMLMVMGLAGAGLSAAAPAVAAVTWDIQYGAISSPPQNSPQCDSTTYAKGCFVPATGNFFTQDWQTDGQRVAVYWWTGNGTSRHGLCINDKGANGSDADREGEHVWVACNNSFAAGTWVHFQTGRCDGSLQLCDRPWDYTDWTDTRHFQAG